MKKNISFRFNYATGINEELKFTRTIQLSNIAFADWYDDKTLCITSKEGASGPMYVKENAESIYQQIIEFWDQPSAQETGFSLMQAGMAAVGAVSPIQIENSITSMLPKRFSIELPLLKGERKEFAFTLKVDIEPDPFLCRIAWESEDKTGFWHPIETELFVENGVFFETSVNTVTNIPAAISEIMELFIQHKVIKQI